MREVTSRKIGTRGTIATISGLILFGLMLAMATVSAGALAAAIVGSVALFATLLMTLRSVRRGRGKVESRIKGVHQPEVASRRIGTRGTIASGEYRHTLERLARDVQVFSKACPLFVPLAEEGWIEGEIPRQIATEYLEDLQRHDIDTLVLGCTHYPLLKATIAAVLGPDVTLVDSAQATSEVVHDVLSTTNSLKDSDSAGSLQFLVSDAPERFAQVGNAFLNQEIENVEWAKWLEETFRGKRYDLTIISHVEPMDIGRIYSDPDYYIQYDSQEFRDIFAKFESATSDADKTKFLQEAQRKIADDAPVGFLFELAKLGVAQKGLTGMWPSWPSFINEVAALRWN